MAGRNGWRADPVRVAKRRGAEKSGDPAAARRIRLKHVHGAGVEHAAEVDGV